MSGVKNITIKQVALDAGVSIQTVSRVINNRYDVAPQTRQRVQEAINRLGYQPNAIARGLASRRSRTLGLVTYDFNDYAFTQVVTGAEEVAHQHGYFFMLGNSKCDPCEEPKYLRLLTQRHVDGVLFARLAGLDVQEFLNLLANSSVPVVVTGYHRRDLPISVVDVDNQAGARQAVEYLLENGHRQIACITGPLSAQSAIDRLAGYRQALENTGISYNPHWVVEGNFTARSGYLAMQKLFQTDRQFTAIFSHNDRMAIGALSALHQAGLRVPEDISIIGYDDIPEAEFANPPLTTIRQNMVEIGAAAARLLIHLVENPGAAAEQVLLGTQLVLRQSVHPHWTDFSPHPAASHHEAIETQQSDG